MVLGLEMAFHEDGINSSVELAKKFGIKISMGIKSSIYNGVVSHSRLIPKNHSFSYKVYSILFNIDEA